MKNTEENAIKFICDNPHLSIQAILVKYADQEFEKDKQLYGVVVFYEPNYQEKTVKEIGRTSVLPYSDAMYVYAETANPASQIVKGETEEEIAEELKKLEALTKDAKWLEELFECI